MSPVPTLPFSSASMSALGFGWVFCGAFLGVPSMWREREREKADSRLQTTLFWMVYRTSILLHQPHSQLDSSPARSVTACTPHRAVAGGPAFNIHTQHTLSSAADISRMITHRAPILSHTHFFICVVSVSSIVHLSRWAQWLLGPQDDDDLRQLIRLNIGALDQLGKVWLAASTAASQVRGVAQEIYSVKKARQVEPSFWQGLTQGEVITAMATDETIMSEIESLHGIAGQ